jgi:DNA-directed RNA polymerase subunit K/omega
MAAETQDFTKYFDQASTLYEAVMVIAQRAKEINEELVRKRKEQEVFDEMDLLGEEEENLNNIELTEDKLKEDKPLVFAQNEFLDGKLEYFYEQRKQKR